MDWVDGGPEGWLGMEVDRRQAGRAEDGKVKSDE